MVLFRITYVNIAEHRDLDDTGLAIDLVICVVGAMRAHPDR